MSNIVLVSVSEEPLTVPLSIYLFIQILSNTFARINEDAAAEVRVLIVCVHNY